MFATDTLQNAPQMLHLVEKNAIRERQLFHRLVLDALRLLLIQVLSDVLGVDNRADSVQFVHLRGNRAGENGGGVSASTDR